MAYDSEANKRALYEQQRGVCPGCFRWFHRRNFTVDHIRAQALGGGHGIGNLQLLCGACNSRKGVRTHEDLIGSNLADGVVRVSRSLLTRKRRYEPTGEGTMSPVAATVAALALPYVVAGAVRTMEIAYEHRAEIKEKAGKQAEKVKGIKLPEVRMPDLPRFRSRHEKWNAEQAERMNAERWWWWTASGASA